MYLAGTRVAGVTPWVPAAGAIGLGVSIFTYGGKVTIGLRADAGLVPDPEAILIAFRRELSDLAQLDPQAKPKQRSGRAI